VKATWRDRSTDMSIEVDSLRTRTLLVLVELLRTNRLTRDKELALLGEHLFVTLFGPAPDDEQGPRSLFMEAVRTVAAEGKTSRRLMRVSLEIDADAANLGSWPWEYLYIPEEPHDPDTGFFVGERTNFVLTRQLPLSVSEQLENIRPPLKILFVVLSPASEPPATLSASTSDRLQRIEYEAVLNTLLDLRKEEEAPSRIVLRVLTEEHRDNGERLPDEEIGSITRATYRRFQGAVEDFEPHVVHIIGHGRYRNEGGTPSGQIAFLNPDSTFGWVSDKFLANGLQDSPSLRLVFLQACESAETQSSPYQVISGLAQRLAQRGVPAIIAMHFQVQNQVANEFAQSFYRKLAERTGIEVAMHAARRELRNAAPSGEAELADFAVPVLYLRGSGALLTPLEVPAPPVRTVAESTAAEPPRPVMPDAQRYGDQGYPHPAVPGAERWQGTSGTPRDDTDWRAGQGLAAEHRERR
jgi:CHAT domain-containing protein